MATPAATITMTMREVDRLKTIQAVVDRMGRVGQAARRLGLSRRQLERLIQRYEEDGVDGLVSHKRGWPSNRQLAPDVAECATALIRDLAPIPGQRLRARSFVSVAGYRWPWRPSGF